MLLLVIQSGIPVNEQSISHDGRELNNPKATMKGLGVRDNAMLLLRRRINVGASGRWAFGTRLSMKRRNAH